MTLNYVCVEVSFVVHDSLINSDSVQSGHHQSFQQNLPKISIFDGFGSSSGLAKLELTTFVYLPLSFLHTAFTSEIAPRSFSRCIFFRNLRI
mgnify:CR=1 FL=1